MLRYSASVPSSNEVQRNVWITVLLALGNTTNESSRHALKHRLRSSDPFSPHARTSSSTITSASGTSVLSRILA